MIASNARRARNSISMAMLCATCTALGAVLAGCQGGTPWGATPQHLPLPQLPRLEDVAAHVDAGTTAGSVRLAERVRSALAGEPGLAGTAISVEGLEGGLVVLSGTLARGDQRTQAIGVARQVTGVRQVVDRMTD